MKLYKVFGFLFFGAILLFTSCQRALSEKIVIAVAANMQVPMEVIAKKFTEKHGVSCELIIGSSGKLTAQIVEGAPYDIFVAANMKYPETVFFEGRALGNPRVYAHGKLVLWSMSTNTPISISTLTEPHIRHIAVANPKTAPYGVAALEVLHHYGLFDAVENKLVYGESIAQTDQFITSEAAQIGFTAMSTVLSPQMKGKGSWIEIDADRYMPISQGVIKLKRERTNGKEVQELYDFLFSGEAKEILKDFGYLMDE
ncbi:MAG TPA: molybdate ABC transporter substrate-binding protein [Arenibacter sp.]|nr:molybdate ABC transporter substrate-binding protein [Arenibacter sp.]